MVILKAQEVCKARILTSKMEQINGSSFNVKYKRFLQKVASVVKV